MKKKVKIKARTRKSAVKRFKLTKGGKILHRSQQLRHLRSAKSKNRVRRLRTMKETVGKLKTKVKKMLVRG